MAAAILAWSMTLGANMRAWKAQGKLAMVEGTDMRALIGSVPSLSKPTHGMITGSKAWETCLGGRQGHEGLGKLGLKLVEDRRA